MEVFFRDETTIESRVEPRLEIVDAEGSQHTRPSDGRMKVLCAEDEAPIALLIRRYLERAGYAVLEARDGEQAWRLMREERVDLLVTDLDMPALPGLELIERIRSHGDSLPVVIASGNVRMDDAARIAGLGVSRTLFKPFSCDELVEAVGTALDAMSV